MGKTLPSLPTRIEMTEITQPGLFMETPEITQPEPEGVSLAHEAYVAFIQICKGNSDDAGTYEADEELVRCALKRLSDLEKGRPAIKPVPDQPEPEGHQAIAKRAIESCLAQRDEVLAAFIAKYGFQPEDAILVEQRQPDGTSTWRTERRPGPEPVGEALTVQECNDMHKHRENYIYECSYGDIELDGVFSREDLLELARTIPANQQPPES
jgi:hypothetical protein